MKTTIILGILALGACKNDAASTAPVPGPMPAPSGFAGTAPQGAIAQQAAPPSAYATDDTATPTQPVGGASCRAAAAKLVEMGERTKSVDQHASDCEQQTWSPKLRGCIVNASSNDALLKCVKIAFDGVPVQFTAKRSYELGAPEMNTAQPRMFTQEGDEVTFNVNGKHCGMIIAKNGPAAAAFVICDGAVIAGPLVEEQELRGVVKLITEAYWAERTQQTAEMMTATHNMTMNIMKHYPMGGGTWEVRDASTGQRLYTTY